MVIGRAVPGAEEAISYDMPAMKLNGKFFVGFAAWKKHIAMYPVPKVGEDLVERVAGHQTGKGTLQFPLKEPMPLDLIEKLVKLLEVQRAS